MYNAQPYIPNYNPQPSLDRINDQISQLETMKKQLQQTPPIQPQPTNLTQNFQLAPTTNREVIKYANSIDEVERDMVIGDTPYFSKDMSIVWVKNTKGDIKTYELTEIVLKDDKDVLIDTLQSQIKELTNTIKEMKNNEQRDEPNDEKSSEQYVEPIKSTKSTSVSTTGTIKKK